MRQWFEVRVREKVGPDRWMKKSKFYFAKDTRDAAGKYKGPGTIMSCTKVGKEKPLGIGDFFNLGDKLLKEFAQQNKEGGS